MTTQTHTPDDPSSDKPIQRRNRWENSKVPERRCTAHKRNGDRCGNPAIHGGTVCGYHGGNAPAVKAKARLRLEMAADRMAKRLLGLAEAAESEAVALAATRDALDRSGPAAKTAVSVEVGISKPFERVFDSITSGQRDPAAQPALADESESLAIESGDNGEIVGEIDDDEIEDDPYLSGIHRDRGSESSDEATSRTDPRILDVEVVADEYTDAAMSNGSGPITPDDLDSSARPDAVIAHRTLAAQGNSFRASAMNS